MVRRIVPVSNVESTLLELRTSLLKIARSIEREEAEAPGETPGVSTHPAEQGSERSSHDLNLERLEAVSREIGEIDGALERVREGSYGICDDCGEAISPERLEAIPYARLCFHCKKAEEAL